MHENKIYTGIGSRETPKEVLELMKKIGYVLAGLGWVLRSGHAVGADQAFEDGVHMNNGPMEIYLPWAGFERAPNNPHYIIPSEDCMDTYQEAMRITSMFHPAWGKCTDGARKLHTRNVYQVAGKDLSTRTNFIICWTKDGKRSGGTGQALRMAEHLEIPIFDLAVCSMHDIEEYLNNGVIPS